MSNDEHLIKGCLRGDRDCQELVYRKYSREMYAICLSYGNDRSAAQDMLQDGFLKVFTRIKSFDQKGSFEGWIRRIVINTAIDHLRRERRIQNYIEVHTPRFGFEPPNAYENINLEQVLSYIRQLPEGARTILNLFSVEGYSHKEIAQKLEISVGTSKSQFSRARSLLMEMILRNESNPG